MTDDHEPIDTTNLFPEFEARSATLELARMESRTATKLRTNSILLALATALAAPAVAYLSQHIVTTTYGDVAEAILRVATTLGTTIPLAALSTYLARQSGVHRRREEQLSSIFIGLELAVYPKKFGIEDTTFSRLLDKWLDPREGDSFTRERDQSHSIELDTNDILSILKAK